MRNLAARGATAGAIAGLLSSAWSLVLVEPVLQQAIDLEEPGHGPVSRTAQRLIGLPVGTIVVGISLGLLFALAYRSLPQRTPPWPRSMGLALSAFVALVLIPQMIYPANPPGVGSGDTIGDRTENYFLSLALGALVVLGSYLALLHLTRRQVSASVRQCAVACGAVFVIGLGYAVLPSPEPVEAPATLVWQFRVLSLGALAVLYAVLGATFGVLSERAARPITTRPSSVGLPL